MYRLILSWYTVRASFWFVPCLIVALLLALGVVLVRADDSALGEWVRSHPQLFGATADGAREMVSTIAASMMGVAGTVFSITLVALALASSQYSSRVLRTFMRSKTTQCAIGIFAGVFVYCLAVLRRIDGSDEREFVPLVAVAVAALLAVVVVVVLIYFIHHIALSIQSATILAMVREETLDSIKNMYPERLGAHDHAAEDPPRADTAGLRWVALPAMQTGYIQSVDERTLIQAAVDHDILIRLEHGPGQFVIATTPLLSISAASDPGSDLRKKLTRAVLIHTHRTVQQDASFGIRELVDVALKGLSPGINDTSTAVMCIDQLTAIMAELATRTIPDQWRHAGGALRLIVPGPDFGTLLGEACDQIRHNGIGNVAILVRLATAISTLASLTAPADRRAALTRQLDYLDEAGASSDLSMHDRALLMQRIGQARAVLAAPYGHGVMRD